MSVPGLGAIQGNHRIYFGWLAKCELRTLAGEACLALTSSDISYFGSLCCSSIASDRADRNSVQTAGIMTLGRRLCQEYLRKLAVESRPFLNIIVVFCCLFLFFKGIPKNVNCWAQPKHSSSPQKGFFQSYQGPIIAT